MEKAKIWLLAAFVLIGAALVFVFRKPKTSEEMAERMERVRAAKAEKRLIEEEVQEQTKQEQNEKAVS
jgi:Flp pilus assembly protein TadB